MGFSDQENNAGDTVTTIKRTNIEREIHLKYVDDFSLAESINLKRQLVPDHSSLKPEPYHQRTGHKLPVENSKIYHQLLETKKYADTNLMKLNLKKTKLMLFNLCKVIDFRPTFAIDDHQIEFVEEFRLLGLVIRSDLKWKSNTSSMVRKANQRLWLIKCLKKLWRRQSGLG